MGYNACQLGVFQAGGATSQDLNDAAVEFLLVQGATPASVNDMWFEYLSLTYTGSLSDMRDLFWIDQGCQPD